MSNLSDEQSQKIENLYGKKAAPLDIQRMYLEKDGDDEKIDGTYFAIDTDRFLNPEVYEGKKLNSDEDTVVLDDDFETKGIRQRYPAGNGREWRLPERLRVTRS